MKCMLTSSRSKRMNSRPDTSVRKSVRWSWLQTNAFLDRNQLASCEWAQKYLLVEDVTLFQPNNNNLQQTTQDNALKLKCVSINLWESLRMDLYLFFLGDQGQITGWLTWNNTSEVVLGSPGRGAGSSLKSSHSMPGTTMPDLHRTENSYFLFI